MRSLNASQIHQRSSSAFGESRLQLECFACFWSILTVSTCELPFRGLRGLADKAQDTQDLEWFWSKVLSRAAGSL